MDWQCCGHTGMICFTIFTMSLLSRCGTDLKSEITEAVFLFYSAVKSHIVKIVGLLWFAVKACRLMFTCHESSRRTRPPCIM